MAHVVLGRTALAEERLNPRMSARQPHTPRTAILQIIERRLGCLRQSLADYSSHMSSHIATLDTKQAVKLTGNTRASALAAHPDLACGRSMRVRRLEAAPYDDPLPLPRVRKPKANAMYYTSRLRSVEVTNSRYIPKLTPCRIRRTCRPKNQASAKRYKVRERFSRSHRHLDAVWISFHLDRLVWP